MKKDKKYLINIFNNTEKLFKNINTNSNSKFYDETFVANHKSNYNRKGNVKVIASDTVSAIHKHKDLENFAVLNMASYKKPGGGCRTGARAQEEDLSRCSNLCMELEKQTYPMKDHSLFWSDNIKFIKDSNYLKVDPVTVDVISFPAMNLNRYEYKNIDFDKYKDLLISDIKMLFDVAESKKCYNLLLGAWGCGVFKNFPQDVAHAFNYVLNDLKYKDKFDNVIFAIINDRNSTDNNFDVFNKKIDQSYSGIENDMIEKMKSNKSIFKEMVSIYDDGNIDDINIKFINYMLKTTPISITRHCDDMGLYYSDQLEIHVDCDKSFQKYLEILNIKHPDSDGYKLFKNDFSIFIDGVWEDYKQRNSCEKFTQKMVDLHNLYGFELLLKDTRKRNV